MTNGSKPDNLKIKEPISRINYFLLQLRSLAILSKEDSIILRFLYRWLLLYWGYSELLLPRNIMSDFATMYVELVESWKSWRNYILLPISMNLRKEQMINIRNVIRSCIEFIYTPYGFF